VKGEVSCGCLQCLQCAWLFGSQMALAYGGITFLLSNLKMPPSSVFSHIFSRRNVPAPIRFGHTQPKKCDSANQPDSHTFSRGNVTHSQTGTKLAGKMFLPKVLIATAFHSGQHLRLFAAAPNRVNFRQQPSVFFAEPVSNLCNKKGHGEPCPS
jgi:hypothetical protein